MSDLQDELTVGEGDHDMAEGLLALQVRDSAHGNVPAGRSVVGLHVFLEAESRTVAEVTLLLEAAGLGSDEVNRAWAAGGLRATGVADHADKTERDGGGGDCECEL